MLKTFQKLVKTWQNKKMFINMMKNINRIQKIRDAVQSTDKGVN